MDTLYYAVFGALVGIGVAVWGALILGWLGWI